jgi:dienelactone hydrolase
VDKQAIEYEARTVADAEAAVDVVRSGHTWKVWQTICTGFHTGRLMALRKAGTNQPMGKNYNRAFSTWLGEHPKLNSLDKATRNHCLWCAEHQVELDAWFPTLADNQREVWNHPTTVKRNYEKAHGLEKDAPHKPKAAPKSEAYEQELERIARERDDWKKKAETADWDNPVNWKKDDVHIIAGVIVQEIGPSRLVALHKELGAAIAHRNKAKRGKA